MTESHPTRHTGSCHCGAVKFEADVDLSKGAGQCNCSLCIRRAVSTVMIKPSAFRLLAGEDWLGDYQWGYKTSHFHFCKKCGIQVFGRGNIPQIGGEYVSVVVNCLDGVDPHALKITYWDGRHDNWEAGPRDTPWPI